MDKFEKVLKKGKVQITIKKLNDLYIATVNCVDDDSDVEFGCTGDYASNAQDAAWNALDYYTESFPYAPCPLFGHLIRTLG